MYSSPGRGPCFLSILAASLIGALLVAAIPVVTAAVGDALALGEVNRSVRTTTLRSQDEPVLRLSNGGDGSALDLRVGQGNRPFTVDSNKRIPKLNADRLDGHHAAGLVPELYASATGTNKTLSTSYEPVVTEIEGLPFDGPSFLINGTVTFEVSSATTKVTCGFSDGIGTGYGYSVTQTAVPGTHTMSLHAMRGPDAGGRSGVDLHCRKVVADGSVYVDSATLTVLVIPDVG